MYLIPVRLLAELICHVLQWLADTCQYNTTLYCERGHSTFTEATGHYFKPLQSLAEFTPLRLTALGPTFWGNRARPFHWCTWNNFIWRGWKYSRCKERGHLWSCGGMSLLA